LGQPGRIGQILLDLSPSTQSILAIPVTVYRNGYKMDEGYLVFEYNLMIIERYITKSKKRIAPGKHVIVVDTTLAKPAAPAEIVMSVDGKEVARLTTKRTVPLAFTASETFAVGVDLVSPVSRDYALRRPFEFDGAIEKVTVKLK
jgi:hypothetical protein